MVSFLGDWYTIHLSCANLLGWSTSIEPDDLSLTSLKLLKLVVTLERLKSTSCLEKRQTYADLFKLLFSLSKFTELKDTRKQQTVCKLCAEAKYLVSPTIKLQY